MPCCPRQVQECIADRKARHTTLDFSLTEGKPHPFGHGMSREQHRNACS